MNITKLILWSALMGAGCVYGQNQTFSSAVYFETGQSRISAKDSLELERLVQKLKSVGDYEISIMAYTDDRGSEEDNQKLAASRSLSVTEFLKKHQLPTPSRQTVQPVGEIALGKSKNVEETRRQNRRVDIVISCFAPKDVNELFSYFSERNKNQFNYNSGNDTSFFGKRGTMLTIPAEAFVLANGKKGAVKYPIQVELREAYTFGEMLAHNVSTVSNGKLIQTGGMVYVGAKDANGNELALANGKEIEVGMPAKGALPEGMQVFVSDRAGHDNATNTNWRAQTTPFVQNSITGMLNMAITPRAKGVLKEVDWDVFKPIAAIALSFPDTIQQQMPQMPTLPKLVEVKAVEPTTESVKKQFKQQKKEKPAEYEARIAKQLETQKKNYERKRKEKELRQQEYNRAMDKYAADMKTYEQALAAYNANHQQAKDYFAECTKGDSSAMYVQLVRQASLWANVSDNIRDRINYKSEHFRYLNYYISVCKKYQFDSLANEFVQLKTELKNQPKASQSEWNKAHAAILKDWNQIGKDAGLDFTQKPSGFDLTAGRGSTRNEWTEIMHATIAGKTDWESLFNEASKGGNGDLMFVNFVQRFYKNAAQKNAGFDPARLLAFEQRFDSLRAMAADSGVIQRMAQLCKSLNDNIKSRNASIAKKELEKMDEGNVNDLGNISYNLAKVGGLGWVNCDRFYNEPNLILTQVNCQTEEKDLCFMVFPELSLVVNLQRTDAGFKIPDNYAGVPANAKVKVIGLRTQEGKVQSFQIEAKTNDLSSQKPSFKPTKVAELADLFASI